MAVSPQHQPLLRAIPGALLYCGLLTALTVALAAMTGWSEHEALLRPWFYALLYAFFRSTSRRHPELHSLPMRLVQTGFLVLTLSSAASSIMVATGADHGAAWTSQLRIVLDRGAIYLLGLVLLAYGLMLWIPMLLHQHRQLAASYAKTRDDLREAETARTTMEQKLVEQHRLTLLGELAASIAHDLRNPLAIVKGAADSLVRRQRSPEAIVEHAEIIRRGIDKADRTIRALIDLGRPHDAQLRAVRLQEPVLEVLALVDGEGRRNGLQFAHDCAEHTALADRELLVQILLNLLLNAAQVSPKGSTIEVRCRKLNRHGAPFLAIAVEDRGPGLPAEIRRRVFTPFFTTRNGGTGLGLLSSRRMAGQMGGELGLYPRSVGGARALLLLPAAPVGQAGPQRALAGAHA